MAQYDVHRNVDDQSARDFPFLVDVQADFFRYLGTRLVVPLGRLSSDFKPIVRLTPMVEVDGQRLLFLVNHMVSIPRSVLGPIAGSIDDHRAELLGAIDFLLTGA